MNAPYIHPATPPRLVKRFKALGYRYHALADEIEVNPGTVYNLIAKGKEPTDKTEKGRAARRAMYLPSRKRSATPKPQPPEWVKPIKRGIRKMAKDTRKAVLR